jgi:hypothetical protein
LENAVTASTMYGNAGRLCKLRVPHGPQRLPSFRAERQPGGMNVPGISNRRFFRVFTPPSILARQRHYNRRADWASAPAPTPESGHCWPPKATVAAVVPHSSQSRLRAAASGSWPRSSPTAPPTVHPPPPRSGVALPPFVHSPSSALFPSEHPVPARGSARQRPQPTFDPEGAGVGGGWAGRRSGPGLEQTSQGTFLVRSSPFSGESFVA